MNTVQKIKVWDGIVRIFHWSLLIAFVSAYWTAQAGKQEIHERIGYFITALLVIRIIWGFVGTTHARFSNFLYSPATVVNYVKAIVKGHPERHLGHNPAGGVSVVILILTLLAITITGFVVLAVIDFGGPLLGLLHNMSDQWAYNFLSAHTILVKVMLGLIVFHLAGVIVACFQHRENLVSAMITGHKYYNNEH